MELSAWIRERGLSLELSRAQLGASQAFVTGLDADLRARPFDGLAPLDAAQSQRLLLDIAAFVVFDDYYDGEPSAIETIDWAGLAAAPEVAATAPEVARLWRGLVEAFEDASEPRALEPWLETGVEFLELQARRSLAARTGGERWTELSYLLEAEVDSSVRHLIATGALLFGLDGARLARTGEGADPRLGAYVRSLGVRARLLNDLASYERERGELNQRNLVLRFAEAAGLDAARALVDAMARRCAEGLEPLRRELGAEDPLAELAERTLAVIETIYAAGAEAGGRYSGL